MTIWQRVRLGLWIIYSRSLGDQEMVTVLEQQELSLFTKEQISKEIYRSLRSPKDPWVLFGEWAFPVLVLLGVAASVGLTFGVLWLITHLF
jgi:hypothetical protein